MPSSKPGEGPVASCTLKRSFPLDQCILTNGKLNPTNQEAPFKCSGLYTILGTWGSAVREITFLTSVSESDSF